MIDNPDTDQQPSTVTESTLLSKFCEKHRLSASFIDYARRWFDPLVDNIVAAYKSQGTICIGITGCQGSGKSTLADYCELVLQMRFGLTSTVLSLDDLYLTKSAREQLGKDIHPLLSTRGVPGTHDTELGKTIIGALKNGESDIALPQFDKLSDDRSDNVKMCRKAPDVIIFEGWCLGAEAQDEQSLSTPINDLESTHDADSTWRRYANQQLFLDYKGLFDTIDYSVMLKAPSFDQVFKWRLEQEQKLVAANSADQIKSSTGMSEEQVRFFIAHYQRITEHVLETLPERVNYLLELDAERQVFLASKPIPFNAQQS